LRWILTKWLKLISRFFLKLNIISSNRVINNYSNAGLSRVLLGEGGGGGGTQYARDSLYQEGPGGIPLPPQRKIDEIESGGTF